MVTRRQFTRAGAGATASAARPVVAGASVGLAGLAGRDGCTAGNAADSSFDLADEPQPNSRITLRTDASRRGPPVNPDDHPVFVSLGCAAETLAHAARV